MFAFQISYRQPTDPEGPVQLRRRRLQDEWGGAAERQEVVPDLHEGERRHGIAPEPDEHRDFFR